MLKTHSCGELRVEHVGNEVTLAGWVNKRRDMGGLIFIDLRDRSGKVQAVVNASNANDAFALAETIRSEYVLQVRGTVAKRLEGMENSDMATGSIEVMVQEINILNASKTPPILIDRDGGEDESLRLKYRYLDLRRERMQRNLIIRHNSIKFIRDFLDQRGFLEIETPILFKSTPEGARDYLVPSRVHPGKFFALPQSPQQLKQLLMVAGYERYFQVARCFRDEDQRKDRQPEFTQLDMEISFVERDDILDLIEEMMIGMINEYSIVPLASQEFPRISYKDAVEKYGTDRPDLRYGLEIHDISDIAGRSSFSVFVNNVAAGNPVRAIKAPGFGSYSRKQMTEMENFAKEHGAKGLAWIAVDPKSEQAKGYITRFFDTELLAELFDRLDVQVGDAIFVASDEKLVVRETLGAVRTEIADRLGYTKTGELAFCWVVDFPLFEETMSEGHYAPSHHMFTSPKREHIPMLDTDPHAVLSEQYDLVCNGYEVAGGSIRIHERELQNKIMTMIGFSIEEAKDQFGHMLEAFEFGAPPHGGIAPGLDRIISLMCAEPNIREVMAFPKNQSAQDVMADAPSFVSQKQIDEAHIALAGRALLKD